MNQGRAEGDRNRLVMQVKKKLERNLAPDVIADALEEKVENIEEIIAELKKE